MVYIVVLQEGFSVPVLFNMFCKKKVKCFGFVFNDRCTSEKKQLLVHL